MVSIIMLSIRCVLDLFLSVPTGSDDCCQFQVEILLRELCRLHGLQLPPELEKLKHAFPHPIPNGFHNGSSHGHQQQQQMDDIDSDDPEEIEVESDQDSEAEEDLQLEVDEAHNTSKVSCIFKACVQSK